MLSLGFATPRHVGHVVSRLVNLSVPLRWAWAGLGFLGAEYLSCKRLMYRKQIVLENSAVRFPLSLLLSE